MFEDKFAMFGEGGLFSDGAFLAQGGMLIITALALTVSFMLCRQAMRAASAAREVHGEAHTLYQSLERQAQQMQMMGDDMRRMSEEMTSRQDQASAGHQSSDKKAMLAGDGSAAQADEPARQDFADEEDEDEKSGSFFRGLLRRR